MASIPSPAAVGKLLGASAITSPNRQQNGFYPSLHDGVRGKGTTKEKGMTRTHITHALVTVLVAGIAAGAEAAPLTRVQYINLNTWDIVDQVSSTAQTIDTQTIDILADYGDIGIRVTSKESSATASWFDEWTVTGGSGTIEVVWSLDGSITLDAPASVCTNCTVDPGSVTYSSLFGASSISSGASLIDTFTQSGAGTLSVNTTGSLFINYVSGQTFGAGFRLNGGLSDEFYGGSLDFLNTALLTAIILPAGATLTTASGEEYNVVNPQPIPEPATVLLLASGLACLGRRGWRARTRSQTDARRGAEVMLHPVDAPALLLPKGTVQIDVRSAS